MALRARSAVRSGMRVTVLELAASWGEPARVLDDLAARLAAGPATDLVLVPEAAVTIAICYDVHFLARDAARELASADLLLFPSAWVERPDTRAAQLALLAQHAGLTIANANWAPGVVRVPGQGGSCIVAPDGTVTTATPGGRLDCEL